MRLLLVAYDYPPIASPQAIRWYYLTRELARKGVDVHVLAPDLVPAVSGALPTPDGVVVHRTDPGGVAGWVARRRRVRARVRDEPGAASAAVASSPMAGGLNWKGRLYQRIDRWLGMVCFPDSRGQWLRPAQLELRALVSRLQPDVVISSHEPATSLELGLGIADRVPAWLADLGDPVLAPYTPARWRRRAAALEQRVCARANAVSVTTETTRSLLIERHRLDASKVWVLTQGFDENLARAWGVDNLLPGKPVRLFYAGRFYRFRRPDALFEAVCRVPGVSLAVASPDVPDDYRAIEARSAGRIVFLGELPHDEVLAMQAESDLLVNIGNALDAQIPGKLYEYLGSGKPILHLSSQARDPAAPLVEGWGCGWAVANESGPLEVLLERLTHGFAEAVASLPYDRDAVSAHGWSRLGEALLQHCQRVLHERQSRE